ncbi:hypothetical protein GUJ93_ZPchr0011g27201 [Zizania palustris]|uniref:Uncharacterized protein n=1 Tax=Zizania palustris TaxID=103762 RepID=A0A8J5WDW6_ZIZPA|nr:hypothetical protein GUJ93_ZPchr0011g27201 [Zizania palustris]
MQMLLKNIKKTAHLWFDSDQVFTMLSAIFDDINCLFCDVLADNLQFILFIIQVLKLHRNFTSNSSTVATSSL